MEITIRSCAEAVLVLACCFPRGATASPGRTSGEANIMATLGRETLGLFGSAREAYEAADEKAELKLGCLGMTVEELEVLMTRERKIRKGQRRDKIQHFCLYEATISSTALADIPGTVAPIACAAQVASRPPIGAVEATAAPAPAPVAAREPGNTLRLAALPRRQAGTWDGRRRLGRAGSRDAQHNANRIVRHVHLFWGLQHYREWALRGTPGARRGPPAAPRRATTST
jgi:hypothetical protein